MPVVPPCPRLRFLSLPGFLQLLAALSIVAPVFALVALGFTVARARLVSAEAGNALSEFVFVLAIPALLFRTVSGATLPDSVPFPLWITYFAALAVCWAIAHRVALRMGRDARESAIIGFSAGQANTVLVGIPMILGTLGERGTLPAVLIIAVHLPITMSVVTLLIARGESGKGSGLKLLRSLVSHPILIAIAAGILWKTAHVPTPDLLTKLLKYLGDAAAPCALVAMGMSMTRVSFAGHRRLILLVSVLKLVLHPLLVYLLGVHVFHLPPNYSAAAIIFAACPTGINAFLVAERYRAGAAIASGAIAFSTIVAVITMTIAVSIAMTMLH
jgi:malonate transporter and related proteins